jgi:Tfp pilus assembly protein PilN
MAQQVNLCTPIMLTEKRYFSANTMVQALGVFLILGGALCAAWVWNLQKAIGGVNIAIAAQAQEIESLQAAIQRSRSNAAPVDPALQLKLGETRNAVVAREQLLAALRNGLLVPGFANSDRLRWVAASIPASVWVTSVKFDSGRFEVTGYTLEPSALNDWVGKLSASPLMHSLKLSDVKVTNAAALSGMAPGTAAPQATPSGAQARWAFTLVSVEPPPQAAPVAGSKP